MGLKMVSCLVLAMSALMIAASAAATTSNNIGTEGFGECLGALTNLKPCEKVISEFLTKGKFVISRECCENIGSTVRNCLASELQQFGITPEQINILTSFCQLVHGGVPIATPAPEPMTITTPTTFPKPSPISRPPPFLSPTPIVTPLPEPITITTPTTFPKPSPISMPPPFHAPTPIATPLPEPTPITTPTTFPKPSPISRPPMFPAPTLIATHISK